MDQSKNSEPNSLVTLDVSSDTFPVEGSYFGDLTYRLIKGLTLTDRSLARSLWNGAVLQDCNFTRVDFSRSDFAGTKFISCTFIDCNFEPNELRSCFLSDCTFQDCSLVGLQCVSSQLIACRILDCDLSRSVIRETRLAHCKIRKTKWPRSSVTLNKFSNCTFEHQAFADTTVLFVVFDDCQFDQCAMNAESVGFTFGLSDSDAQAMKWVYLGEKQEELEGEIVDTLIESYRARRWYLGLVVLELNFNRSPAFQSLTHYSKALLADVSAAPRIDLDELTFMTTVLEQLAQDDQLPFYGLWRAASAIEHAIQSVAATTPGFLEFSPASTAVLARLRELMNRRILEITEGLYAARKVQSAELKLTMEKRPLLSLLDLFSTGELTEIGIKDGDLKKIDEYPGSWVEVWQMGLAAFGVLHLTLATIDTTWEHVSNIIEKTKKSAKAIKKSNKDTASESLLPETTTPPATMDLRTVAAAVERASLELKPITELDRQAVAKLDMAVQRLASMSEDSMTALADYASPNLTAISIDQPDVG